MSQSAGPILVTGATGNVGREVLRALLARGARVRVGIRRPDAESDLGPAAPATVGSPTASVVRFDFEDPATHSTALAGCHGLFLMRPNPIFKVKRTLNRVLDAAAEAGVQHVAFLSVAGADKTKLVPHHAVEHHLMSGPMSWTMLRAGFFAQNLTGPYRRDIRAGTIVLPAGEGKVAYVDAYDLGEVAAQALLEPQRHARQAYHLTGPDSLTFAEVAALLTAELGRPIRYQPASLIGYWRHCRRQGVGRFPALAYTGIHAALRNGSGAATDPTLARLLGRPGRSLREFIADHRSAWS